MADTGDDANLGGFDLAAVSEAVSQCRRTDGELELATLQRTNSSSSRPLTIDENTNILILSQYIRNIYLVLLIYYSGL